jgi:hypothetical protein
VDQRSPTDSLPHRCSLRLPRRHPARVGAAVTVASSSRLDYSVSLPTLPAT